uniref:Uncharacterized protein n=1 Tax=Physcomitrium patens TaxID=3218 RepID=A0A2K1KES5_PHYPA|nr:hypothetical protein PHYPA_008654 [Physcomitrium patens]
MLESAKENEKKAHKTAEEMLLEIEASLWSIFEDLRLSSSKKTHCDENDLTTLIPHNGNNEESTGRVSDTSTSRVADISNSWVADTGNGRTSDTRIGQVADTNTGRAANTNTGWVSNTDTSQVSDTGTGRVSDAGASHSATQDDTPERWVHGRVDINTRIQLSLDHQTSNCLHNLTHKTAIHTIQAPRGKNQGEVHIKTLVYDTQPNHLSLDINPLKSQDSDQYALINMAVVNTKKFKIWRFTKQSVYGNEKSILSLFLPPFVHSNFSTD